MPRVFRFGKGVLGQRTFDLDGSNPCAVAHAAVVASRVQAIHFSLPLYGPVVVVDYGPNSRVGYTDVFLT